MFKVLLTGFGPFSVFQENPSQKAVESLSGTRIGGGQLHSLVLPVSFRKAAVEVKEAIHRLKPDFVCMLGFAPLASGIEVEHRATRRSTSNVSTDELLPDNDGETLAEQDFPLGPSFLKTTWPHDETLTIATSVKIPASISNDAGNYVCNFALYIVLNEILTSQLPTRAGFFHVPHFNDSVAGFLERVIGSATLIHQSY